MMGAIIGDIVGSVYEWHNIKKKRFSLFRKTCFFTDDTVMTAAVAEALMNGGSEDDFIDAMKKYGKLYPDAGYGIRFDSWIHSDSREPYQSYGNGSAMRVSPVGWIMDCDSFAKSRVWPTQGQDLAKRSAAVTHNHPEGIKGAMAVADAIFICRLYRGKYSADSSSEPILSTLEDCKRMGSLQSFFLRHLCIVYSNKLQKEKTIKEPKLFEMTLSIPKQFQNNLQSQR